MNFVENTLGLKVLTPDGYKNFAGIALIGYASIFRVEFGNKKHLECTKDHRLFSTDGLLPVSDLKIGQKVYTKNGKCTKIKNIIDTGKTEAVYDLIDVGDDKKYLTNGILSKNCSFISDTETLLDGIVLSRLKSKEPLFYTGTTRWYEDLKPNCTYLVSLDPSAGTGGDYSAIVAFRLPGMVQVLEWNHNRTGAPGQIKILLQLLNYINYTMSEMPEQQGEPQIYWTIENNSIGEANLVVIESTGEDKFPGSFVSERRRKGVARGRFRKGLTTTNARKLSACVLMKNLIETERMIINSSNALRQLKFFVARESSFAARPGEHDDIISACLLCVRMLDTITHWGVDTASTKEDVSIDDEESDEYDAPMPMSF